MSLNIQEEIKAITLGKKLPDAIYMVLNCAPDSPELMKRLLKALDMCPFVPDVVKFALDGKSLSLLSYPNFWNEDFPVLKKSFVVKFDNFDTKLINYEGSKSPQILHRKETLVSKDDPRFEEFREVTLQLERNKLFENSRKIGYLNFWLKQLENKGFTIRDGRLSRC